LQRTEKKTILIKVPALAFVSIDVKIKNMR